MEASSMSKTVFAEGHACIVGVGADLPNTEKDAIGLADILKDPERCAYSPEQVHLLTGEKATRANILSTLDELARATDSQSTVIVYFSGHGYRVTSSTGESYYLMPYGYNQNQLDQTAISGAEFTARLQAIPAQKLLVLLDCCHAGGMSNSPMQLAKSPLPPEAQQMLSQGRGRAIIASSRGDELSYAGRPYSAFTTALLEVFCGKGVSQQDGYVRVTDLALHTREVVPRRTRDKQHPTLNYEQADNFVMAYYAGGEAQPKGLPFGEPEIEATPGEFNREIIQIIGGDYTGGNKVSGDNIVVGNLTNVTGVAIGRNASAVVNISNQLQSSTDPEARRLAYLIERLKSLVQTEDSGLSEKHQAMAMKLLNDIGKLGSDRQNSELQMSAETALLALPGILNQGPGLDKNQTESSLQGIREILRV
jgi:hypothetical protein